MNKKTFTLEGIQDLRKAGLYFLYKDHELVYIGVSKNVYVRILEHSFENKKEFDSVKTLIATDSINHTMTELIEVFLIHNLKPTYNKMIVQSKFTYFCTLPSIASKELLGGTFAQAEEFAKNLEDNLADRGYES